MRNSSARPPAVAAFRRFDRIDERWRNPVAPADDAQPHAFASEVRRLIAQILLEQSQQRCHFARRAAPNCSTENAYRRERADTKSRSGANDAAHGGYAGAMTLRARKTARSGPAAVAVEQNGDVKLRRRNDSEAAVAHMCRDENSLSDPIPSRVARISASIWSRYFSSARRPAGVSRYSVFGTRPENDFVQLT